MPEVERIIPIPGTDKRIYGLYREVSGAPLVVFVHGLTGNKNEHQWYNGARALEKAGFSTFRFDLYAEELDARNLVDCTVDTHAADLDLVLSVFKEDDQSRRVSVIGHSLGALTILRSQQRRFDCVVLWDPAAPLRGGFSERKDFVWDACNNWWLAKWGTDMVVSEALRQSWVSVRFDEVSTLGVPVKTIAAEKGVGDHARGFFEEAGEPKAFTLVPDADHCFNTGDTADVLFSETISWLDAYGR